MSQPNGVGVVLLAFQALALDTTENAQAVYMIAELNTHIPNAALRERSMVEALLELANSIPGAAKERTRAWWEQ